MNQPTPTIDMAVAMRNMSMLKEERLLARESLAGPASRFSGSAKLLESQLRNALYAGMILTFTQGMALLHRASQEYQYNLPLAHIARIWRGGCIIRAELLNDIYAVFTDEPALPNLLLSARLGEDVLVRQDDLRDVVHYATSLGLPVPGFMASLAYFDAYRSSRLPANLIQAQRDYFGAHTYERMDEKGRFHTEWAHKQAAERV